MLTVIDWVSQHCGHDMAVVLLLEPFAQSVGWSILPSTQLTAVSEPNTGGKHSRGEFSTICRQEEGKAQLVSLTRVGALTADHQMQNGLCSGRAITRPDLPQRCS